MILSASGQEERRLKLEKKYASMLDNFSYYDDGGNNAVAKTALKKFYNSFKNEQPNQEYTEGFSHMGYIINIIPIYTAIKENRLSKACHELRTLLHNQDFLQPRIKANILYLLREFFKLGD